MIQFDFIEDTFIKKNTSIYELSILLGMDSLVYMITDGQQKIHALSQFPYAQNSPYKPYQPNLKPLERYVEKNALLQSRFRNVRLGIHSPLFSIVPNRLYSEKDKRNILSHLSSKNNFQEVIVDQLPPFNGKNVYGLLPTISDFIKRHFSSARVFNLNTTLLLAAYKKTQLLAQDHQLFFHADSKYLRTFLFERKNLLVATQHQYQTPQDFIYFALLTFEQFRLSVTDQQVHICGQIHQDSELFKLLFRYIKNIHFLEGPAFIQKGEKSKSLPDYAYFDLFSALLLN